MAAKKVIEVNESSIVDLKAELFRKEQLFRKETEKTAPPQSNSQAKKPPVWAKQKKEKGSTAALKQTSYVEDSSEEEQALQKSKKMLQAKAVLYEKMAKGEIEDDDEDDSGEGSRFLVDFHKKVYNKNQDRDEEDDVSSEPIPPPSGPDEEWVEYVDSLGRSRKCLRKDLPMLQRQDKELRPSKSPSPPTLLSEDMRRELMRQKWEKEEEEAMNRPVGPVHYQDIRFEEVRTHGVGYYQFSTDETERVQQMETLSKLRQETVSQRSRSDNIKAKRKAALEARLAKVRARKKIKAGDETTDTAPDESTDTNPEEAVDANPEVDSEHAQEMTSLNKERGSVGTEERPEPDVKKLAKKRAELPEWARHKIKQYDRRPPLGQKSEERDQEFAPPSFYYEDDRPKQQHKQPKWKKSTQENQQEMSTSELTDPPTGEAARDQHFHGQQNWVPYPPFPPPPPSGFAPPFPPPPFCPPPSGENTSFIPTHLPPPPQERNAHYLDPQAQGDYAPYRHPPPPFLNAPQAPPCGFQQWSQPQWQGHQPYPSPWQHQNVTNQISANVASQTASGIGDKQSVPSERTGGATHRNSEQAPVATNTKCEQAPLITNTCSEQAPVGSNTNSDQAPGATDRNGEQAPVESEPKGPQNSVDEFKRTTPSAEVVAEFVSSFRR